jgi:hypothetical protein
MKRVNVVGLCLVVAFAISAAVAASALANEGPFYKVKGVRLASGSTKPIAVKALTNQVLVFNFLGIATTITCKEVKVQGTPMVEGSNTWEPGKIKEIIRYTECTQTGLGASCEVTNKEIVTNPVISSLSWSSSSLTSGNILVVFKPVSGTEFYDLKFTGSCLVTDGKVTGSLAAEARSKGATAKVGTEPAEAATGNEINFPATQIKEVFTSTSETAMTKETIGFEFGGKASTFTGSSEVTVGSPAEAYGIYTK